MAAFVIGGIIGAYCVWVLRKKYRDLRDGHACCGCGGGCRGCRQK